MPPIAEKVPAAAAAAAPAADADADDAADDDADADDVTDAAATAAADGANGTSGAVELPARALDDLTDGELFALAAATMEEPAALVGSTLFVEGIPFKITEEAFSSFLASQGCPPTSMRLPVWQDSGNLRGFGHVVFASAAIAKKATDEIGGKNFPALMNRCVRASERASERKKESEAETGSAERAKCAQVKRVLPR